jgi:hypothetical protein
MPANSVATEPEPLTKTQKKRKRGKKAKKDKGNEDAAVADAAPAVTPLSSHTPAPPTEEQQTQVTSHSLVQLLGLISKDSFPSCRHSQPKPTTEYVYRRSSFVNMSRYYPRNPEEDIPPPPGAIE